MTVIFARPRHEYQSYSDLWELVRLSGYPLVYIDEIDIHAKDTTYIFTSPDAESGFPHKFPGGSARIIYYLLEWYRDYEKQPGVDEVWTINETFAEQIGAKFVPVGSHPKLRQTELHGAKAYDVAHLFYVTPRRHKVLTDLTWYNIEVAPTAWGRERDVILNSSQVLLHVHQNDGIQAYAPLRLALAAAYKMPAVVENGWSLAPIGDAVFGTRYSDLAMKTDLILRYPEEVIRQVGDGLYECLCVEHTFRKCVEREL